MTLNLEQVRAFALSLPEATEEPHFHKTSFRIRGKIFMTAEEQDPCINVFVGDADREPILAMHADWAEQLMWGKKAVGLRVNLERADPDTVHDLLRKAWLLKAPQSLADARRTS